MSSSLHISASAPGPQSFFTVRPAQDHRIPYPLPPTLAAAQPPASVLASDDPSPRMRSHNGNRPSLPQSKHCPLCPAKFTRTTHLNRHLRTHTNERLHRCDTCMAEFTRSDLLTRHKRSCGDLANQNKSRRKSCQACAESKVKCDLKQPCTKCISRGKECIFVNDPQASREKKAAALARRKAKLAAQQASLPELDPSTSTSSSSRSSPSPVSSGSVDLTPVVGFGLDSASSLTLSTPSSEPPSIFDFPGSDMLFTSPMSEVGVPHCADLGAEFAAAFRVGSDLEALDQSLAKLMADDGIAAYPGGEGIYVPSEHTNLSMHDLSFPPFDAAQWLSEDIPNSCMGSMAEMATSYMGAQNLYAQNAPAYADASISSIYPPSGAHFLSSGSPAISNIAPDVPTYADLQHYLYLFHTSFLSHLPLVHMPTWSLEGKPEILIRAMYACGALFVKNHVAQQFVATTLESTREQFRQAAENPPSNLEEQLYLVLAGLLLQSIWFMHHRFEDRTVTNSYHASLVMMIHRSGFISRCAAWTPPRLDGVEPAVIDASWRDWAFQETIKRILCVAYLQDVWFSVFFGIPPSSLQANVDWCLPSDDSLWRANSPREWLDVLRQPQSPYGLPAARLVGYSVKQALLILGAMHVNPLMLPLSAFAHYFLIHAILMSISAPAFDADPQRAAKPDSFVLQHALHNWFNSWTHAPDSDVHVDKGGDAPRLVQNARPYYLLAQVSLLSGAPNGEFFRLAPEQRYRVIQQWMPHIRSVIRSGEQAPPAMWVELMRMAVKDASAAGVEQGDGLALYFPEL